MRSSAAALHCATPSRAGREEVSMELKSLQYDGFSGACECYYVTGALDGTPSIIFIQGPGSYTSVTNAIEDLVNLVLPIEFPSVRPDELRYFLHYPSSDALVEWEEVVFASVKEVRSTNGSGSWLARLLGNERRTSTKSWTVSDPVWKPSPDQRVEAESLSSFFD